MNCHPNRSKTKPNEVVKIKESFSIKREPQTPPQTPPDNSMMGEVYEVVEDVDNGYYQDPLHASTPNDMDLGRRISAGAAALKVSLEV